MQSDVVGAAELEDEPPPLTVFRDVAEPGVIVRESAEVGDVDAVEQDRASRRGAQPAKGVDQLRLPVAVDPCDADDLTGFDVERDLAHLLDPAVVERGESLDREQRLPRLRPVLVDPQENVAADHQPRQALLRRPLCLERLDLLAAAEHGDPVRDLEHLVQLVGDEDDRLALRGQARG